MNISAEQQQRIDALCRRYGVRQLRIFGSAATGDERPDSDVDLLVEFVPGQAPSAFAVVDMRDELSTVFGGRAIDLAFGSVLNNPLPPARNRAAVTRAVSGRRPKRMTIDRAPAYLSDMHAFVRELRALLQGRSLAQYMADRVLNLAVEKLFINLCEAACRLAESQRAQVADVPWRQIIGLRNILAHGYEQVDHETLFRTVTADLGAVESALPEALARVG